MDFESYPVVSKMGASPHLSFIVPDHWHHDKDINTVRKSLAQHGIKVYQRNWNELVESAEKAAKELNDAILNEAIGFWKWRFEMTEMTDDEREFMLDWPNARYSASRKLEKTLDQTRKLFEVRGFETQPETADLESYGFYIKRNKSYLLWVGMWTKTVVPLAFGYHRTELGWIRPKKRPARKILEADNDHNLWAVEPKDYDKPERVYAAVVRIFKNHLLGKTE